MTLEEMAEAIGLINLPLECTVYREALDYEEKVTGIEIKQNDDGTERIVIYTE
jgi:hypothetical protein